MFIWLRVVCKFVLETQFARSHFLLVKRQSNLKEDEIQKLHTTAPEQLTDQELLLSTISATDLVRKHSGGWDKEHPKCLFCSKAYRHRTFTVQCHMTSQVTVSGKHKCETVVCSMESTKDDVR